MTTVIPLQRLANSVFGIALAKDLFMLKTGKDLAEYVLNLSYGPCQFRRLKRVSRIYFEMEINYPVSIW